MHFGNSSLSIFFIAALCAYSGPAAATGFSVTSTPAPICEQQAGTIDSSLKVNSPAGEKPFTQSAPADYCPTSIRATLDRHNIGGRQTSSCVAVYANLRDDVAKYKHDLIESCRKVEALKNRCGTSGPANGPEFLQCVKQNSAEAKTTETALLALLEKINTDAKALVALSTTMDKKYLAELKKLQTTFQAAKRRNDLPRVKALATFPGPPPVDAAKLGAPNLGQAWSTITGADFDTPTTVASGTLRKETTLAKKSASDVVSFSETAITERKAILAQLDGHLNTLNTRTRDANSLNPGGKNPKSDITGAAEKKDAAENKSDASGGNPMDAISKMMQQIAGMAKKGDGGGSPASAPPAENAAPAAAPVAVAAATPTESFNLAGTRGTQAGGAQSNAVAPTESPKEASNEAAGIFGSPGSSSSRAHDTLPVLDSAHAGAGAPISSGASGGGGSGAGGSGGAVADAISAATAQTSYGQDTPAGSGGGGLKGFSGGGGSSGSDSSSALASLNSKFDLSAGTPLPPLGGDQAKLEGMTADLGVAGTGAVAEAEADSGASVHHASDDNQLGLMLGNENETLFERIHKSHERMQRRTMRSASRRHG